MTAHRQRASSRTLICLRNQRPARFLHQFRTRRWPPLLTLALLLIVGVTVISPAAANATYDPLGSGTTNLTLDKRFAGLLHRNGVKLLGVQGATRRGRSYTLPVSGGTLDPTTGQGEIDNEGTLVFQRGARRVPLRHLVVKTKREPLIAKVGGGQLKLAAAKRTGFSRQGFGSTFAADGLRLSAKLATRLAKKLRLRGAFRAGQPFAALRSSAQPLSTAILPAGRATFAPDPTFLAKLDANFISLNPVAPAERSPGPLFSFPIIGGGSLAPDASLGTLRTGGAVEFLHLGSGQLFWTEPWFDLGLHNVLAEVEIEPTPTFPGKLGQVPVLDLHPVAAASAAATRTISVTGSTLTLQPATAAYFNQAFVAGEPVFAPGELVGYLTFTAQAQ